MAKRYAHSLALAALLVLGACTSGSEAASPKTPSKSSSEPSPTPTIQDVMAVEMFEPVELGPYFIDPDLDPSTPLRVEFEIPSEGWSSWIGAVKVAGEGFVGVAITTVTNLVRHGCLDHSWAEPPVGSSVDDLASALADLAPFRVTSPPKDITIYGYSGKHLEFTVPDLPVDHEGFTDCIDGSLNSYVAAIDAAGEGDASFNQGEASWHGYTGPGYREEFWILDVEGTRLMIAAERSPGSPPGDLAELQAILDSIRIEPTPATVLDSTPSRFVGEWASTDYNDHSGTDTPSQTMTIRAGEEGVLHITVHDDSACSEVPGTMTGTGRLEDPTTLVVPSPDLTCLDGSIAASDRIDLFDGYTLVLDLATDRLYDSLGVVWNRGALAQSWTGESTEAGVNGPGTFSLLHGEVTFRAAGAWDDHFEAYIDPRLFFLIGPGGEGADEGAEMTILVNPLPPEAPCDRRVPPSAEELVQAIRSNPDLEATAPVLERVGGMDALRMDVVAAPGASVGPCVDPLAESVDVVSVPGKPWGSVGLGDLGRLFVLDLPGGSARTLAIWITAPDAAVFQQALDAAAPVLDSFEFHAT